MQKQEKLKIFYKSEQTVERMASDNSFGYPTLSPSAKKPRLVVEDYLSSIYSDRIEIMSDWEPISKKDFYLVHDMKHVNGILECRSLNGFGNKSKEIADSLYYTSGSFVRAAIYAYINKCITMSPTSGFHHAGYSSSEGFCTFNGLMIAAVKLRTEINVKNIGIIDYDAHWGNGTDDIINKLGIDYVQHVSLGKAAFKINRKALTGEEWVNRIEDDLNKNIANSDIILYQSGADPHINDPYGGLLTTEQMYKRDCIVFDFAKKHNIPIVWNLAGGYQEPIEKVLELHMNTLKACVGAM